MRKWTVILISFFTLLIIAALQLPDILKQQLKSRIISELEQNLKADFSISNYELSSVQDFPHISIQMNDFLVRGIDSFDGDTIAYAKKVRLLFNFWGVYNTDKMDIRGIYLFNPDIRLEVNKDGASNYDIFNNKTDSAAVIDSSHFNLKIQKWLIENGSIQYHNVAQNSVVVLKGLNHQGSGSFTSEADNLIMKTNLDEGNVKWKGLWYFKKKPISFDLIVGMNFKDSVFTIKENKARIGHFGFSFDGQFKKKQQEFHSDIRFNIHETSFKELFTLLPGVYKKSIEAYHASGDLQFNGHINGPLQIARNKWPGFSANLKVENGEFKHPELHASLSGINIELVAENKKGIPDSTNILIKRFTMKLDTNPVSGYMLIYGTKNPYIKADIKTKANLEVLERLFKLDSLQAKGNLDLNVVAEGYYNAELKRFPKLHATINLTKGSYKSAALPTTIENIHVVADITNTDGNFADTRIRIDTLTYTINEEPFFVKGTLEDLTNYAFDIELRGLLDFEKLAKVYPIENTKLSGKLITKLKAKGTFSDIVAKKYQNIDVSGIAIANNVHYSNPEFQHRLDITYGMFSFSPERIRIDRFTGIIGTSNILAKGEVSHYLPYFLGNNGTLDVMLDVKCDSLNLNEWLLKPDKPDTNQIISAYKLPENLYLNISTEIGRLLFDKLEIDRLKGSLSLKEGVLRVKEAGFNTLGSDFKLTLQYDTRNIESPLFNLEELYIKDLDLNKAYEAFYTVQNSAPAAQHTNGVFTITYKLKGALQPDMKPVMQSLKGGGIVFIKSAQVNGMKMFDHISSLTKKDELKNPNLSNLMLVSEIDKGRLLIRPFKFKINKYEAELEGFHDFEGTMAYIMKIGIPPFEKAKIPIHIEGTYSKPHIRLGKGHSLDSLHKAR